MRKLALPLIFLAAVLPGGCALSLIVFAMPLGLAAVLQSLWLSSPGIVAAIYFGRVCLRHVKDPEMAPSFTIVMLSILALAGLLCTGLVLFAFYSMV